MSMVLNSVDSRIQLDNKEYLDVTSDKLNVFCFNGNIFFSTVIIFLSSDIHCFMDLYADEISNCFAANMVSTRLFNRFLVGCRVITPTFM